MALVIPPKVAKQLRDIPGPDRERLLDRLERIATKPLAEHRGVTAMVGQPDVFRVRQGDWRAVYSVSDGDVILDRVGHRREVYR